jgi:hypothetical protein
MATVRRSNQDSRVGSGRVNPYKLASSNEADIERFARDDESETTDLGEPRYRAQSDGRRRRNPRPRLVLRADT